MAETTRVMLGPSSIGQRLDVALASTLEERGQGVSRSALARVFSAGGVTAAGKRLKAGTRIDRPYEVDVTLGLALPQPLRAEPEALALDIVFEDEHVLVVNKAAGMVVHPAPGHPHGTLVAAVLHHLGVGANALPVLPGNDHTRPGIVHRLDKDTSGLLVVAKTVRAQQGLSPQFEKHRIARRYCAVVSGVPSFERRSVETTHARDPADRRRFSPATGKGRRALSHLRVTDVLAGAAVLRVELETGRTHQIRMHARHLGHPIFGDALYGRVPHDPERRELWQGLGRHALHAELLGLVHPLSGQEMVLEVPLPAKLRNLIAALTPG